MDKVERPDTGRRTFKGTLKGGGRHGRIALAVKDFSFAHGERVLFDRANLDIEFGERVCLVGPNGSGKTTLFRSILDEGDWENPVLRLGRSVRVGEYRQLHDVLDPTLSLLDWTIKETGLLRRGAADLLHRFLFTHDDLERSIGSLSGGEKSRLQLARLVHEKVNFLLLDEPTNHIDIPSCEALEEMLLDFEGTLLVISHDRYFLDKLVERVVELEDRALVDHRMTFAEWWRWKEAQRRRARRGALEAHGAEADKDDARQAFAAEREAKRERARRVSRVKRLETRIHELEARQEELDALVLDAFADHQTRERGEALAAELESVRRELAASLEAWEAAAADMDDTPTA